MSEEKIPYIPDLSKPVTIDSLQKLSDKYRDNVINLAKANVKIKELERINGKYEAMEIHLGLSDYWNIYAGDLIYILKNAPQWIGWIVSIIKIINQFKEMAMNKAKMFDIVTTVLGVIYFVWQGLIPIFEGEWTWIQVITAALGLIAGYFMQGKKLMGKKEKAV